MKAHKERNDGKVKLGDIAKKILQIGSRFQRPIKRSMWRKADKLRYATELKTYLEASGPAGALRKKYQDMIPKKPNTAYFLFIQDSTIREKASEALKTDGKEAGTKQLASKLGEMWKAASSEDKARFEEEFKKDQVQFFGETKSMASHTGVR